MSWFLNSFRPGNGAFECRRRFSVARGTRLAIGAIETSFFFGSDTVTIVFVMMLLAHPKNDCLLVTISNGADFLLGSVGNAPASLYRHLLAVFEIATLSRWSMGAAQASLFDILGTARMLALLALGPVSNAQSSLDDTIRTTFDAALSPHAFARSTRGQDLTRGPAAGRFRFERLFLNREGNLLLLWRNAPESSRRALLVGIVGWSLASNRLQECFIGKWSIIQALKKRNRGRRGPVVGTCRRLPLIVHEEG